MNYPPAPSNFVSEDATLFIAISKFEDQRHQISKLIHRSSSMEHKTVPTPPVSLAIFDVEDALRSSKEGLKSLIVACEKIAEATEKSDRNEKKKIKNLIN